MTAVISGTNGLLQSVDYPTLTTGFTYNWPSGYTTAVFNPGSTLASGTINFPTSSLVEGMVITFSSSQQITALSLSGGSASIVGAVTSLNAKQAVSYVYRATGTTWYLMGTQAAQPTGPTFAAGMSANQVVSVSTATKLTLNTEIYDTASCYNNTASTVGGIPAYSFLPNVAGYYYISFAAGVGAGTSLNYDIVYIYVNGVQTFRNAGAAYNATTADSIVSALIYLNGTSDYIDFYVQSAGSGTLTYVSDSLRTRAQAFLARAA